MFMPISPRPPRGIILRSDIVYDIGSKVQGSTFRVKGFKGSGFRVQRSRLLCYR
jgi:hypothetical protein